MVASLVLSQGASGYVLMGRITGTVAAVATLLCCWGLAPFAKKAQRPSGTSEPLLRQLKRIRTNGRFVRVLGLYLLLWFGLQDKRTNPKKLLNRNPQNSLFQKNTLQSQLTFPHSK